MRFWGEVWPGRDGRKLLVRAARWNKNESLPPDDFGKSGSDDFGKSTEKPTHFIQSGHMTDCWKGDSLNYNGKIVSGLF